MTYTQRKPGCYVRNNVDEAQGLNMRRILWNTIMLNEVQKLLDSLSDRGSEITLKVGIEIIHKNRYGHEHVYGGVDTHVCDEDRKLNLVPKPKVKEEIKVCKDLNVIQFGPYRVIPNKPDKPE